MTSAALRSAHISARGGGRPAREGPLVEVRGLRKHFVTGRSLSLRPSRTVRAVDGIDLEVEEGETFGLVGESGCGKSTLGRLLVRLLEPTSGSVYFDGTDLASLGGSALRRFRSQMQVVFQDPFGSLDPHWRVARVVAEPLRAHGMKKGLRLDERVAELLEIVGLDQSMASRLPGEMSGGQRQRVGIARAIAAEPRFIVADEPVSALDVSVQAQVVNLLSDLQDRLGITYVLVAHGLNVVRHVSTRVGVMYLGRMVEVAPTDELFSRFAHPYTASLLSAVLTPATKRGRRRIVLPGEVGSAAHVASGCRFHPRCPLRQARCETDDPALTSLRPGHLVACHFPLSSDTDRSALVERARGIGDGVVDDEIAATATRDSGPTPGADIDAPSNPVRD